MANYPQPRMIRQLFYQGQPLVFGKAEVVLGNRPEPNGVYYIGSGYVKAYSIGDDGDEYLHIIYGPGEIFPIIWAYLEKEREGLFYEALTSSTLWRISRGNFIEHMKTDAEVSFAFSLQLARQFQTFVGRVDNLEHKRADARIIYRILFLAIRFGKRTGSKIVIDVPLTHEMFAHSVNLTRESVSRHIGMLEKERAILHRDDHKMEIIDLESLLSKVGHPNSLKDLEML